VATKGPEPAAAIKRGPGRPRKESTPSSDPRPTHPQPATRQMSVHSEKLPHAWKRTCTEGRTRAQRHGHCCRWERAKGGATGGTETEREFSKVCRCNTSADQQKECAAYGWRLIIGLFQAQQRSMTGKEQQRQCTRRS
jgi:hypothetical protein